MKKKITLLICAIIISTSLFAGKHYVTNSSDYIVTEIPGTLRYCIENATSGDSIFFDVDSVNLLKRIRVEDQSLYLFGNTEKKTKIIGDGSFGLIYLQFIMPYSFKISNLQFTKGYGGASVINSYVHPDSDIEIRNCDFIDNESHGCTVGLSYATIANCTFADNYCPFEISTSLTTGLSGSYLNVDSCIFNNNKNYPQWNSGSAGAAHIHNSSISNCSFTNNYTTGYFSGGAIQASDCIFTNCTFEENSVGYDIEESGGAGRVSNTEFYNCVFNKNSCIGYYGKGETGGVVSYETVYVNCLFIENTSRCIGGVLAGSGDRIVNCTFHNNHGDLAGGIFIYFSISDDVHISNCILYANTPVNYSDNDSRGIVSHTASNSLLAGTGNILLTQSPFLTGPTKSFYYLHDSSACIDAGDSAIVSDHIIETDLVGNARIVNDTIDIGAIEFYPRVYPNITWPEAQTIHYGQATKEAFSHYGLTLIQGQVDCVFDTNICLDAGEYELIMNFAPYEDSMMKYKPTETILMLSVYKAPLQVTANDTTITIGDTEPVYRLSYNGFVLDETSTVLNQEPMAYVENYATLQPGVYNDAIIVSDGQDNNYVFSYIFGNLTVLGSQAITSNFNQEDIIFPNPASTYLTINENWSNNVKCKIYDLSGKLILSAENERTISLHNFTSGTYVLELTNQFTGDMHTQKFIISK